MAIFAQYLQKTERNRWNLESDVPWEELDVALALEQPDILATLRQAALVESYAPMYALKGLQLWWDSIEESAVASIQFYEEYKHYVALSRYLQPLGYDIPEREIIGARQKNAGSSYPDRTRQLTNYMISEHFTAHFYERLLEQAREPVMKRLLTLLVADEFRHCQVFYSLLERRLHDDPAIVETIVDESLHFRHQAAEVVGEQVPVSMKNDFHALLLFWKKIELLTGVDLREQKKALVAAE